MAPRRIAPNAIVICLDVGPSMARRVDEQPSLLERACDCICMILQRKIFSSSRDEVALVLMSSRSTDNMLHMEGQVQYSNIRICYRPMQVSWQMEGFVSESIKASEEQSSFIDALVVCMTMLHESEAEYSSKSILLFSNLDSSLAVLEDDQMAQMMAALKREEIEVKFFGEALSVDPDEEPGPSNRGGGGVDDLSAKKTPNQLSNERTMRRILTTIGSEAYTLADAEEAVARFEKGRSYLTPYKFEMSFGNRLSFPVKVAKRVSDDRTSKTWKRVYAGDERGTEIHEVSKRVKQDQQHVEVVAPETEQQNGEEAPRRPLNVTSETGLSETTEISDETPSASVTTKVESRVIKGFMYGRSLIPYTEADMVKLKYRSDGRGLSVLGTTHRSNVPHHLFLSDSSWVVYGEGESLDAVAALALALRETESVLMVRYIWATNCAPRLAAMIPVVKTDSETKDLKCHFTMVHLPYADDVRPYIPMPEPPDCEPTSDQQAAMDAFVTSMSLMTDDGDEYVKSTSIMNPLYQRFFATLSYRRHHPDEPLPHEDFINRLLAPLATPEEVVNLSRDAAALLKEKFELRVIEKEKKKRPGNNEDENGIGVEVEDVGEGIRISNLDPVGDFNRLVNAVNSAQMDHENAVKRMNDYVINLIRTSLYNTSYSKARECIEAMRKFCVSRNYWRLFNDLLIENKETLRASNRMDFWNILVDHNLSLITAQECPDCESDAQADEETDELTNGQANGLTEDVSAADADLLDMLE